MMAGRFSDFETTMRGLERGLRVEEIATFNLITFDCDRDDPRVISTHREQGIDYLPVRKHGEIIGVLEIANCDVSDIEHPLIRPLTDKVLVSAGDPIGDILPLFMESPYRLVVVKGNIAGIVTRSDLLKLPVRVLAFSQITHLEMLMAAIIRARSPEDDTWLSLLKDNRRENIQAKFERLKVQKSDPPLLECTDFCDKRSIVRKLLGLPGKFERDLNSIEALRNTLAHAGNYVTDDRSVIDFIDRMMLTSAWISELRSSLTVS